MAASELLCRCLASLTVLKCTSHGALQSEGLFDEAYVPTINHLSSGISELSSPIGTPTSPVVDTKDVLAQPLTALLSPLNDNSINAIPLPKSARHRFQAALVKLRERNFVVD
jgi:hypothetical protein